MILNKKESDIIKKNFKNNYSKQGGGGGDSSDESDWEPEAEIKPPSREQTRSGRQRKRPSFFQVRFCNCFNSKIMF